MSISSLFLILSGFLNSLIAFVVIRRGEDPRVKKFYGALAVNVVLWSVSIFLFRALSDPFYVIFWGKVAHIAALGIAFSLFFFAVYFPYARIKNTKVIFIVLLLLSLVFVSFLIFSDSVIDGFKELNGDNYYETGYLYLYYGVFITVLFFISFLELFIKFLKSRSISRTQIKFVFVGLFISANVGVISNLILPGVGVIKYNWLGPVGTFIMLAFFAYAVVKHHLLNVKVIATEIFSALIAVFVLVDALLSKTTTEFVLKFALFGGVAVFGILIIRSVLNEIKSKEKIAQISEDLRIYKRIEKTTVYEI
ncbi:MAG: histidine kinase N-terminal 7TM domain-containing protein [bacterium]|nr:histidine kinase N-terminal 7TM domain-containing protein [bacterium]